MFSIETSHSQPYVQNSIKKTICKNVTHTQSSTEAEYKQNLQKKDYIATIINNRTGIKA